MRLPAAVVLAALALSAASAQPAAIPGPSPLEPAATGGVAVVDRALAKLAIHCRVLVVGAHPDDEDTSLLSLVGTGLGGEAAYLALSRGEGGQNLLGPELGVGLGLIRTGELLAARRLEGTRQYFARAFDFGYTRSVEETFRRWPRATLQRDAVRVARRFKPHLVVAVFPEDERGGHGQHRASAIVARDLFELAGEPDRFPELTAEGLPPWQPRSLYRRVWRGRDAPSLEFALDGVDALSGKSIRQIAAASRSMHRSQDMGTLQELEGPPGGLLWLAGEAADTGGRLCAGPDTRLAALADLLPAGTVRDEAARELQRIAALAVATRRSVAPAALASAIEPLAEIVGSLRRLRQALGAGESAPSVLVVDALLEEKLEVASAALTAAAGVALDALADREAITIGGSLGASAVVWTDGEVPLDVTGVEVATAPGWRAVARPVAGEERLTRPRRWELEVEVSESASPTVPYFLERSLLGDLYDWRGVKAAVPTEPLQPPPLRVRFALELAGVPIVLEREVVHRYRDQMLGEVRRPLRALPPLEVSVQPELIVWPLQSGEERRLEVVLRSHRDQPLEGRLLLQATGAWPEIPSQEFRIDEPRAKRRFTIPLTPPVDVGRQRVTIDVTAILDRQARFTGAYPVVDYPHVRPLPLFVPARAELQRVDLELPELERLGYVRGASDRVPEVLQEIGLPVELLSAAVLSDGDLSRYDAIVIGSRAYEIDAALAEANPRLLDYVREGGHLVVQYQQYAFASGGYAPLRLEIGRPHGRVTDEDAPVRMLHPEHPIFRRPNAITEDDWRGWIQERGLYFASSWDASYTPLLALNDPGEAEERGALLVARVGRGTYIYTGLSFFRELPAGVPGALRLFANMLEPWPW